MWNQAYDPLRSRVLSTLLVALPLVVLLGLLARHGVRAHHAALLGLAGVMGKMIHAQTIVVASTATRWYGHESSILWYVFRHSVALAALVGIW